MIHENTFKKADFHGAKGVIFLGEKILVFRRDHNTNRFPGKIDLPGGGREEDETPFETFKREVKEEFGIEIKENEVIFSSPAQSVIEPDKKSFFIVVKTLCKPEDIVFGDEGTEWMLMTPEEFIHVPDGVIGQQKRVEKYLLGDPIS